MGANATDFPGVSTNTDVNYLSAVSRPAHKMPLERRRDIQPAPLKLAKSSENSKLRHKSSDIRINRQYIPSSTIQLDKTQNLPGNNVFRKLVEFFQFNHEPSLPRSNATVDLLTTIFCFATIHLTYLGSLELTSHRTIALFSASVLIILSLYLSGIYSKVRLQTLNRELKNLLVCGICTFAAIGLFLFLIKSAVEVSRVWISTSMAFSLLSLASVRVIGSMGLFKTNKVTAKNIAIFGFESNIKTVMHSLYKQSNSPVRVAKIFECSPHKAHISQRAQNSETSKSAEDPASKVMQFIENQRRSGTAIDQVWISLPTNQSHNIEKLSDALVNSSVDVCVVPDYYTERLLSGDVNRYGHSMTVNISEVTLSPAAEQFKRLFDAIFSIAALLAFCVPMAIIACLIKMESKGPILFRQKRYGVDGKEIDVLKFRSMHLHTDSQVRQATRNDSRVTRIGKILRSTSLDELPQLFNVLFGSMSLVGPRPHAVAHNEQWRKQIKGYMLRHKVKPGITGWAQVHGWRGETDTAFKMQQRVNHDLDYIRSWSPWLDIKILFLTVSVVFRAENAY